MPTVHPSHDVEHWLPAHPGGLRVLVSWRDIDGHALLASGGTDGTLRVWSADAGVALGPPIKAHVAAVNALDYWQSPDGVRLVSGGTEGTVYAWDAVTGAFIARVTAYHPGGVMSLACWYQSDGQMRLASGSYDCAIRIWDPETAEMIRSPLVGHNGAIISLIYWRSPEGHNRLASGSDDGTVRVWDPDTGALVSGPLDSQAAVEDIFGWLHTDGRVRLAAGSEDGTIRIWDPETGSSIRAPFVVGTSGVWALGGWRPQMRNLLLASAAGDGSIQIWDSETGDAVGAPIRGPASPVRTLPTWQADDGSVRLACAGTSGEIQVCDTEAGAVIAEFTTGHVAAVYGLCTWDTTGGETRIASAGTDSTLRIWDPESGVLVREITTDHTTGVWAICSWQTSSGEARVVTGGLDGTLRVWDPEAGTLISGPLQGHTAAVGGMTSWQGPDGANFLASGGDDAVICVWNLDASAAVGAPINGHVGGVLGLASWWSQDGTSRLASAGGGTSIDIWEPVTGARTASLAGHTMGVWALACWQTAQGKIRLASGGYDTTIRIWDLDAGKPIGEPFTGFTKAVRALAFWRTTSGEARLAAASGEIIRIWNPETAKSIGEPLVGHTAAIRSLAAWQSRDGSFRLASAGDDGAVRLWDPELGVSLRTIEVGPVQIWGLSDAPANVDILGREVLVDAIADQLCPPLSAMAVGETGPTVVTIEGPWGCGKSTLMKMVEKRLLAVHGTHPFQPASLRRLTIRQALRQLHGTVGDRPLPPDTGSVGRRGVATAWFNPWAHESGEQVWAGLVSTIIDAVGPVLHATEPARERYWFARNLPRVDRHAMRRALRRRTISPLLGVALVAVVAPIAIALAELGKTLQFFGRPITTLAVALALPVSFLVAGGLHTAVRYSRGWAADYLPGEIFRGPVTGISNPESTALGIGRWEAGDPLHVARAGSLYLHQHDVSTLLADTAACGHDLVIFIDDLDRCRTSTTAEVFEAINLFLSGLTTQDGLRAHFVIGLDPSIVAAHLDRHHAEGGEPQGRSHGDDPSQGWAFLRKLIQLPVIVPHISTKELDSFIDAATGTQGRQSTHASKSLPVTASGMVGLRNLAPQAQRATAQANHQSKHGTVSVNSSSALKPKLIPWRTMEQHPAVRELMRERMAAQPNRSIREAKRLMNVWQLYERVLTRISPLDNVALSISRTCTLILLSEIITRWPALQLHLCRYVDDQCGFQLLANATRDDDEWDMAIEKLEIDATKHGYALTNLRKILSDHDGKAVADLAVILL